MNEIISYDYQIVNEFYFFYSKGPTGVFKKRVEFANYSNTNLYELVLSDYIEKFDIYGINTVTDNGDVSIIYETLFNIMIDFAEKNPTKAILTRGTTEIIQRLDKIYITKNVKRLTKYFRIFLFSEERGYFKVSFDPAITCEGYIFINNELAKKIR